MLSGGRFIVTPFASAAVSSLFFGIPVFVGYPSVSIPFFDHEVQLACDDDDDDDDDDHGGGMAMVLVQVSGRLVARLAGRWPCCCSRLVRSDNDRRR